MKYDAAIAAIEEALSMRQQQSKDLAHVKGKDDVETGENERRRQCVIVDIEQLFAGRKILIEKQALPVPPGGTA